MEDFKRKTDLIGFDIETNQWFNYTKLLHGAAEELDIDPEFLEIVRSYLTAHPYLLNCEDSSLKPLNDFINYQLELGELSDDHKRALDSLYTSLKPLSSTVYLGSFVETPLTKELNRNPSLIKTCDKKTTFIYSVKEISSYLSDKFWNSAADQTIYVHNLGYECYAIRQTDFFKDFIKKVEAQEKEKAENPDFRITLKFNSLASNKTSIKSYEFSRLVEIQEDENGEEVEIWKEMRFRDTYLYYHCKLEKLGEQLGFPKLPYSYDEIRTKSELTKEDFDYNERDSLITLIGGAMFQLERTDFEQVERKNKGIPARSWFISSNHALSDNYKRISGYKSWINKQRKLKKSDLYNEFYPEIRKANHGGLIAVELNSLHHNFKVGEDNVVDIFHPDVSSQHLAQPFTHLMPTEEIHFIEDLDKECMMDVWENAIKQRDRCLDNPAAEWKCFGFKGMDARRSFLADPFNAANQVCYELGVKVHLVINCKLKELKVGYTGVKAKYPFISKITVKGAKQKFIKCYGSKIVEGENIHIYDNIENIAALALFYDIEIVECKWLMVYGMRQIDPFWLNVINKFGTKKVNYKAVKAQIDEGAEPDWSKLELNDSNYLKGLNVEERKLEMARIYQACKGDFNGIYGQLNINDQKDNLSYSIDDDNKVEVELSKSVSIGLTHSTNLGSYITSYGRCSMMYTIYLMLTYGYLTVYVATDGWTAIQFENSKELPNGWLKWYYKDLSCVGNRNENKLGGLEIERHYTQWMTTASLKACGEWYNDKKKSHQIDIRLSGIDYGFLKDRTYDEIVDWFQKDHYVPSWTTKKSRFVGDSEFPVLLPTGVEFKFEVDEVLN